MISGSSLRRKFSKISVLEKQMITLLDLNCIQLKEVLVLSRKKSSLSWLRWLIFQNIRVTDNSPVLPLKTNI